MSLLQEAIEACGTVSCVVYEFCGAHPIVPFAAGVLIGHLLWPLRR